MGRKRRKPLTQKQKLLSFIGLLLVIDVIVCLIWWNRGDESRFDPQILNAARQYDIDPALVKAVIWQESRFKPDAVGTVGEIGLMQIRPLTAQEWRTDNKIAAFPDNHLFNPQTNIFIGAWYLKKMLKRYSNTDDPLPYALCDYNAGRRKVLEWASGSASTNSAEFMDRITYPTTKKYVQNVKQKSKYYSRRSWKRSSLPGGSVY
ncbi:MAG: lytic transglycosylase domain-containing protein [Verrucomicrobia bacterium]|nr:lytic transglycosylase domain-containing protein [Verrucomicrobiota bacterium]